MQNLGGKQSALWAIGKQRMRAKAEWTIDSEAMRARGIIVLVKIQLVGKKISRKQLKARL